MKRRVKRKAEIDKTTETGSKIMRLFGGRFTDKGDFIHEPSNVVPRRYKCSCNPNGFVSGQVINHHSFCPFHKTNLDVFLAQESTAVQIIVALLVFALNTIAWYFVGAAVINFV